MKTKSLRNRKAAFYVMLAMIAVILIVCVPIAEVSKIEGVIFNWCVGALGIAFGVSGLVVVLLTIADTVQQRWELSVALSLWPTRRA